jgi:arylformamidase
MTHQYWDISVPLRDSMAVWSGDPAPRVEQVSFMDRGDMCNVTRLHIGAHTATHMDAPRHFLANGSAIDQVPFDATIGPARVVVIENPAAITKAELETLHPQAGERLLFKTINSTIAWASPTFYENFVYISAEAAQYLVDCRVRCVGVDYLSIGGFFHDTVETHVILLGAGVGVVEGLDLSEVEPGHYELICLPLRLAGADGAPARAILRRPLNPA